MIAVVVKREKRLIKDNIRSFFVLLSKLFQRHSLCVTVLCNIIEMDALTDIVGGRVPLSLNTKIFQSNTVH